MDAIEHKILFEGKVLHRVLLRRGSLHNFLLDMETNMPSMFLANHCIEVIQKNIETKFRPNDALATRCIKVLLK